MWATALFYQKIPRILSSTLQFAQHPTRKQVIDIPQRRVRRAFANRRPASVRNFCVGQIARHTVQHMV